MILFVGLVGAALRSRGIAVRQHMQHMGLGQRSLRHV
jgi:hypothetical protein